jgi:hypothetical protein
LSMLTGQADSEPLAAKVPAAMLTSAIGITVAQPSDVLKARFIRLTLGADLINTLV